MRRALFIVMTIAFGAFAGAFVWAFFFLMNAGIHLLWDVVPTSLAAAGLPAVLYPIVFCALGGLCIGLFAKKFGPYPDDMNTVMAQVKSEGRYEYKHLGASFFGALLPLLFGGSIGPEAGLTGVIAGLCTWVGDRLRFMGAEMRELAEAGCAAAISAIFSTPLFGLAVPVFGSADESNGNRPVSEIRLGVSKPVKVVVYVLAAAGAMGMMALLGSIFGRSGGLPHFSDIALGPLELLWALPLIAIGAVGGLALLPVRGTRTQALRTHGKPPNREARTCRSRSRGARCRAAFRAVRRRSPDRGIVPYLDDDRRGAPYRNGLRQGVRNAALPEHGLAWRPFLPHHLRGHRNRVRHGSPHGHRPGVRALRRDRSARRRRHAPAHHDDGAAVPGLPHRRRAVLLVAAAIGSIVPVPSAWMATRE